MGIVKHALLDPYGPVIMAALDLLVVIVAPGTGSGLDVVGSGALLVCYAAAAAVFADVAVAAVFADVAAAAVFAAAVAAAACGPL